MSIPNLFMNSLIVLDSTYYLLAVDQKWKLIETASMVEVTKPELNKQTN